MVWQFRNRKNWHHVWLSEGFATYLTHMYLENRYGADTLMNRMKKDREAVIAYGKKTSEAVVNTSVNSDYMQLLNPNSYQKGGWVLHMLRHQLGDENFRKGIRKYYAAFEGKNASTEDFRKVMETIRKVDLKLFFQQWLYSPGQPNLNVTWRYDEAKKA